MQDGQTITGTCHCGAVSWRFKGMPETATACSCTVCRRHGALWAYGREGEIIETDGPTHRYLREGGKLEFHFCPTCGCLAFWRGRNARREDHGRMGVNLRLAEPEAVGAIRIHHLDGLGSWKSLPDDGRRVADMWF